jgi:hypothetical protein
MSNNPISITQLNNGGVVSAIPYSVYRTKLVSNYSGGGNSSKLGHYN